MTNRTQNRRGLAALIPTDGANRSRDDRPRVVDAGPPETTAPRVQSTVLPAAVAGLELVSVRPLQVVPNPKQPRTEFDPDALTELAQSLGDVGFLQPIVVRRIGSPTDTDQRYELVAGNVGGVLHRLPNWKPSRRSLGPRTTMLSCVTPFWRTCNVSR